MAAQADNGSAKQRASANGSSVAGAGGNESRGRPRPPSTSNVALPPKREYQVNKMEFGDRQDSRMMVSAGLNAFLGSPSQEENMPRGIKRRVPVRGVLLLWFVESLERGCRMDSGGILC